MDRVELRLKQLEFRKERLHKWISFLQAVLLLEGSGTEGIVVKFLFHCLQNTAKSRNCLADPQTKVLLFLGVIGVSFLMLLVVNIFFNYKKLEKLEILIKELEDSIE